ncbi:hypothetical protein [Beijerinckia indica]|uniref:Uncharacterized protein n=1 Tax=Beijerinckia indica subsp. indica (strain ATCC 9039 / DSM 1715 / NCIMB 8712) TaxID=395963 RepID=B2III5_BEII9|nr:hypothetical protein [Beijerinckia indica]ACB94678.1 hypothetical protein Bind_1035 [Beijerinckia indica subsp. indica ATCC 9039]
MSVLLIGSVFIGALLGRFFKVLVLIPTFAAIVLLCLTMPQVWHGGVPGFVFAPLLILCALQVGYLMGLLSAPPKKSLRFVGKPLVHGSRS